MSNLQVGDLHGAVRPAMAKTMTFLVDADDPAFGHAQHGRCAPTEA